MEDEVRLRTSVTFGYSPSNRLPVLAHHKLITITHHHLLWVLTHFYVRLVHNWVQHANWWLLHHAPYGNLLCHHSLKEYHPLENPRLWRYPQRRPYHMLFSEMPWKPKLSKHPQRLTVTNCITFIPSLDYPSIWLRKLAISLISFTRYFLMEIGLFLEFFIRFQFIIIGKLLPL